MNFILKIFSSRHYSSVHISSITKANLTINTSYGRALRTSQKWVCWWPSLDMWTCLNRKCMSNALNRLLHGFVPLFIVHQACKFNGGVLLVNDINFLNLKWRHDDVIMLFWQFFQFWSFITNLENKARCNIFFFLSPGFYSRKPNTSSLFTNSQSLFFLLFFSSFCSFIFLFIFVYMYIYIMNRVDGLGFRSNPDLLQRHKTSTNKYISIYRKREGERD